ncbi:Ig-like domain repeat protein [Ruminococcus sp.]
MKINNLMKRLSATIVAIALTFSSLVLPIDAIAAASSSTAVTEDTNTDNSGDGGDNGDSDNSGDNSGEETPAEKFDIADFNNSSEGKWTNGNVSVSFTVKNNIDRIDYAYFDDDTEANRKTSENGKFSFDFDSEQNKEHTFYVVDKEGNVTEVGKTQVKIDRSEPTTDNFYCNHDGKWVNKDNSDNVIVSFTAKDELSGVAYAYVDEDTASNRKNVQTGTDKFTFGFKEDQDTKHKFYVVDNVGHTKEVGEATIKIDRAAPEITDFKNDHKDKWTNGTVKVTFSAKDELSGVEKVYADGKEITPKNGEYSVSYPDQQNKEHTFYAVDKAGNKSEVKSTKVQIDKTEPKITGVTYANISYKDGVSIAKQLKLPMPSLSGMVIARNYIVLEVDASDDMSGIDETDRGSFVLKNDKETVKTLAVEKSGDKFAVIANAEDLNAKEGVISDVKVYAKDRAGNLSDAYKDKITFDTRKPKCGIDGFTLNDKSGEYEITGFKPTTERKVYAIVTSDASLENSSDELAAAVKTAVEESKTSIDFGGVNVDIIKAEAGNKYDFAFPAGNASFYVNVIDEVGNVSEFEFKADKTPISDSDIKLKATHKVDNKETDYTQSSWTNSDVTVEVSVPDEKVAWNGNTATAVTKLSKVYYSKDKKLDPASVTTDATKIERDENEFKQTFKVSGTYYFYAVDEAGNVSEGQEFEIKIDKAAPTASIIINDHNEKWLNREEFLNGGKVTVSFTAADEASGLAYAYVDKDIEDNRIKDINSKYSFEFTKDQNTEHTFYVVDNAGNVKEVGKTTVMIDTAEATAKLVNDHEGKWLNKEEYLNGGKVTVSFKVDSKVSTAFYAYVDKNTSANSQMSSNGKFSFEFTDDQKTKHTFYVGDSAGNITEIGSTWVMIDTTDPEIKEFTNAYDEKWTNGNVDVSFEVNGDVSGIAKVYVDVDDEKHQIQAVNGKYNYTFTDEQDKEHTFYVVDNAGNVSKKTTKIQIDRADPVITGFTVSPNKEWANEDDKAVTVSFEANDNKGDYVSGIAKVYVDVDDEKHQIQVVNGKYNYTFTDEQDKEHTFYVVDTAGNVTSKTTRIKIDKTKPVIEEKSVEIVDEDNNVVNMTRLKWCIIHNKDVKIRVEADSVTDGDNASASGVYSVKLITTNENSYEITKKELNGDYYEFTIPSELLALEVLHENIRFVVTDNAANKSEEYKLKDLTKNKSNSDDILIDKTKPNIKEITLTNVPYTDSEGKHWYNTPNIKASAYFEDTAEKGKIASGLESIQISALNSKTAESDKAWGIKNRTYSVTSDKSDLKADGTIEFRATAIDLAGNEADEKRAIAYVDTVAPVVNKISVNGVEVSNNGGKYAVEAFGNSTRRVEISASDISGDKSGISGLKSITYSLYDENGKEIRTETVNVSGNSASISFDISPNFKGYIKATATDNVGNEGAETKSRLVVVENSSKHNETSNISIKLPQTSKKDSSGNNLYNNDIDVQFSVSDSYSGVKSVSYTIKDRNGENTVTVDDMSVDKNDGNINTELSKTIRVGNNENDIKLTVTIEDNAGNKSSKDVTFSIDKTAPTIEVTFDNNNRNRNYSDSEYYKADRTATVTITERNFNAADVKAAITGLSSGNPTISSFTTVAGSTPDQTKHVAKVTFSKDADYTMSIDFTDMAGNRASQYKSNKFTIDKTKPVIGEIKLSPSPSNSKYFNEDVTVSVTVNEHNFDSSLVKFTSIKGNLPKIPKSDWKDDGDKHTVSFKLKAEDIYSFRVGMTDKAVNAAADKTQSEIVLDKTKPSVEIAGVKDKKAYGYNDKDKVAPVFTFSDTNIDPENVSYKIYKIGQDGSKTDVTSKFDSTKSNVKNGAMTVSFNEFKSTSDVDGLYTIEISSKDLAGNESSDTKVFSVNRYGSSFVIDDSMKDLIHSYISKGEDVKVKIINVNKISAENTTVTVTYNGTNITLKSGADYTFSTISESDEGWCEYEVTINKAVFEKDGSYSVKVTAVDEANNTSTNTDDAHVSSDEAPKIDFYVDTTKPEVTITGAEKDAVYKEVTKQITVTVEDANIDADNLADVLDIQVNGEAVTNYEAEDDAGTVTAKFTVKGDKITIKASAVDKAGNKSDIEELSFRLNANWLLRLYSNKPLFYSILAAILLAAAGVIIIIIRKKK